MKKKTVSSAIILLMFLGSFGAIGTQSNTDRDYENNTNSVDLLIDEIPKRYATGLVGELRDTSDMGITFMGGPPTTFNWKNFGGEDYTSPIANPSQGPQCGSCYAFATIGVVESVLDIQSLNPDLNKDLSEQYIVSCASDDLPLTVWGCDGAWYTPPPGFANFIDWTRDNDVVSESCFPYTSGGGNVPSCNDNCPKITDVVGWGWVDSTQRTNIKNALITQGPLTAYMKVYDDFHNYNGGIYEHTGGGGDPSDHIVTIVGYNENQDYWICKNSWGTNWGENGWFKIKFGNCDIEKHIAFIEVDYGNPTATKHGNEYYDKTDRWTTWGSHGMQCDNYWVGGPDYIYYKFNVPKDTVEGPVIIGVEFKADLAGANGGPDIEVKEPGGSWVKIRQSMGGPSSKTWKWFAVTKDYVDGSNELKFRILCAWGCHAYIDDVAVKYKTASPPPPPEPDLDCDGSLSWSNVPPGTPVIDTFTVENIGDPGSELDWKITEWPNWGTWSFSDLSGDDLTPEEGPFTIGVVVIAPRETGAEFSGKIKVVNEDNSGDYDTVSVSLSTPRNKQSANSLFFNFLEKFPVLGQLLLFFTPNYNHLGFQR